MFHAARSPQQLPDEGPLDPAPSRAELAHIRNLSTRQVAEIDLALRASLSSDWRRLSRVVDTAAFQFKGKLVGVPKVYYAMRLEAMVLMGHLQAQGNLRRMSDCRVRWPATDDRARPVGAAGVAAVASADPTRPI